MRTKHVVFALVIFIAAFSLLRAELPAPLIEVKDTLCHMNNGIGQAKGAVFMPDGKTIIGIMDDTPMVFDAVTGNEIRRLDSIPKKNVEPPQISKDGRYLFANSDNGLAVWNIQTGKIIKYLRNCVDYCLSSDGTKLYQTIINDKSNTGVIRVYDLNSLDEIEVFCDHDFWGAEEIAISPDGQTLAVCVSHDPIGNPSENINRSVILIDLDKKSEFTRLDSFYPYNYNMQFSPDGRYLMYLYGNYNNSKEHYILLYYLESKEKKFILDEDISNLFEYKTDVGFSYFYDNQTISIDYSKYVLIWNFKEKRLKKMINFYSPYHDINNNKLLLCNYQGDLAVLDLLSVSVSETPKSDNNTISYTNNQIDYYSDEAFAGETEIFDLTGKSIANLGKQQIIIGENIIRVNRTLPNGIYILIIKNGTEQYSYKFIAE